MNSTTINKNLEIVDNEMSCKFQELPKELKQHIFTFCDFGNIHKLSRVSKDFCILSNELTQSRDKEIQYAVHWSVQFIVPKIWYVIYGTPIDGGKFSFLKNGIDRWGQPQYSIRTYNSWDKGSGSPNFKISLNLNDYEAIDVLATIQKWWSGAYMGSAKCTNHYIQYTGAYITTIYKEENYTIDQRAMLKKVQVLLDRYFK